MLDLLELGHALVVFDAGGLQLGDLLAFQLVDLRAQDDFGILDHGLDEAEHVEGVARALFVEALDGVDDEQAERLEQREIVLQLGVQANAAALGRAAKLDDARLPERAKQLERALLVLALLRLGLETFADQTLHRAAAALGAPEHAEQHAVRHFEARRRAARARPS